MTWHRQPKPDVATAITKARLLLQVPGNREEALRVLTEAQMMLEDIMETDNGYR